jgi:hypothetical protein
LVVRQLTRKLGDIQPQLQARIDNLSIDRGRVEGRYYPAPLSVRTVRATFIAHGSRCFRLSPCSCVYSRGSSHERR